MKPEMRGLPAQRKVFVLWLWLGCLAGFLSLAAGALRAAPVITVAPSGHDGFDVYADGVLAAPIRLAANGAIVADTIQTNGSGLRLSGLRAKDSAAVTFAADDFISITVPAADSTNLAWEPVVQFK
jgi:hypothetical protein